MKECVASRRSFLKTSLVGAAGAVMTKGLLQDAVASPGGAWVDGMQINPAIDNLRVVCCNDATMLSRTPSTWDAAGQNQYVVTATVEANLDAMAMALAQKPTAGEAWATIFRKPASKTWSQVKVLFKMNCLNDFNFPRGAVVGKVAKVLNGFGVLYSNIRFPEGEGTKYAPLIGTLIPSGVVYPWSDRKTVSIGAPYNGTRGCWIPMADLTFDIIVNFPVIKNHYPALGGCTISMKNHYGTFEANHDSNMLDYLMAITKSDIMIGGTPPRQQLIIVDALVANANGIGSVPDNRLNRLFMGTFGPVMDYMIAKKMLVDIMKNWDASSTEAATARKRFATDFGYTTAQYDALDFIIPGTTAEAKPASRTHFGESTTVNVITVGGHFHHTMAAFALPAALGAAHISIYSASGKMIRSFSQDLSFQSSQPICWDCTDHTGRIVAPGSYAVTVAFEGARQSKAILLSQ